MEPYVKRLLIEYNIRLGNLNKLNNFINSSTYTKLSQGRKNELIEQSKLEEKVLNLFKKRLINAGVKRLAIEDMDFSTALRLLISGNIVSSKTLNGGVLRYIDKKIIKCSNGFDTENEIWNPTQEQILATDYFLITKN